MRKLLIITAVLFPAFAIGTPALPESNFIYVAGQATEYVPPNKCTLAATVQSKGLDQEHASGMLKSYSAAVIAAAKSVGVAMRDIDGSDVGKSVPYGDKGGRQPEMERKFQMKLFDVNVCVKLADKLMSLKGVKEFGARFGVSDEAGAEAKVTASAVSDAKRRAQGLAGLFGRKLGPALAISEEQMDAISSRFGAGTFKGPPPAPFIPSELSDDLGYTIPQGIGFTKNVYVIFRLE